MLEVRGIVHSGVQTEGVETMKSIKTKNYQAHIEWMQAKRIGRPKQEWINDGTPAVEIAPGIVTFTRGFWRKIAT